jgi:predicted transcriptional regulator
LIKNIIWVQLRILTGIRDSFMADVKIWQLRTVTPGFKEQSRVHLIYAPKKTTHIITECIEINVINIRNVLIT